MRREHLAEPWQLLVFGLRHRMILEAERGRVKSPEAVAKLVRVPAATSVPISYNKTERQPLRCE